MALLEFDDLSVTYHARGVDVPAVRNVSLTVDSGESVGIAGESGCGKTTLTSTVLRMQPASATVTGQVRLDGEDVMGLTWGRVRALRWATASVVFQGAMHATEPGAAHRGPARRADPAAQPQDVVGPPPPPGSASCSRWWGSRPVARSPTRTSCPVARSSA